MILETFGLSKGGKEYRRVVAGFERIFEATIVFGTESTNDVFRIGYDDLLSAARVRAAGESLLVSHVHEFRGKVTEVD